MSMDDLKKNVSAIAEEELKDVSGGVTRNYLAALDVMNGKYGNGDERIRRLTAAGYDYNAVQNLVNGLAAGYDKVEFAFICFFKRSFLGRYVGKIF